MRIVQRGPDHAALIEIGRVQIGSGEVGVNETGLGEAAAGHRRVVEHDVVRLDAGEIILRIKPMHSSPGQAQAGPVAAQDRGRDHRPFEIGCVGHIARPVRLGAEARLGQVGVVTIGGMQLGVDEVGIAQRRAVQLGTGQVGGAEIGGIEMGRFERRAAQVAAGERNPRDFRAGEIDARQIGRRRRPG